MRLALIAHQQTVSIEAGAAPPRDRTSRTQKALDHCQAEWSRAYSIAQEKGLPAAKALRMASVAYKLAMPKMDSLPSIRAAISCIAQGINLGSLRRARRLTTPVCRASCAQRTPPKRSQKIDTPHPPPNRANTTRRRHLRCGRARPTRSSARACGAAGPHPPPRGRGTMGHLHKHRRRANVGGCAGHRKPHPRIGSGRVTMRAIAKKPRAEKIVILQCPTCGKKHSEHPEFGRFCCASCLQTVIRPLIVALTGCPLPPNQ